jgi:hypothetical protein
MSIESYLESYKQVKKLDQVLSGICGRVIRGKKPEDFLSLTDDPTRLIVMLIDPEGLSALPGLSGYDTLITLGYEKKYLDGLINSGNKFKLVVFGDGGLAKLATWDNLIDMIKLQYRDVSLTFEFYRDKLKKTAFNDIESMGSYTFLEVQDAGKSDQRYMTYERFVDSDKTLHDVRAFLYFTVHLRELYSGDGYTYDSQGNRGVMEYIVPNKPLSQLGQYGIVDVEVTIPTTKSIQQGVTTMSNIQICNHAPLVFTPNFWNPQKAYEDFSPDLEGAYREGVEYAQKKGLQSAQALIKTGNACAMMATDLQQDFRDSGRLAVKGANDAILKSCVRLLNGVVEGKYAGVAYSMDSHSPQHVSYDTYWRDSNGNPLDLSKAGNACMMVLEDEQKAVFKALGFDANGIVELGYYRPKFDPLDAVAYFKHLQATGQGNIWVFVVHCKLGTDGTNLHPLFAECLSFMEGALSMSSTTIFKGHISSTDWFGPLEACRPDPNHPQGGFQKDVIDFFQQFKFVDFVGIAEDFCDYFMKKQTIDYLSGTDNLSKLRFVLDGTAAIVPNDPKVIAQNENARQNGVSLIYHDSAF